MVPFSMDSEAPWQYDKCVNDVVCVGICGCTRKYGSHSHILFYNEIMFFISDTAIIRTLLS